MNYLNKKTVEDIDVAGKRVLVRCDFNVPFDAEGNITDPKRINEAMKTIKYLIDHKAKVILCSHLGRPKGEFNMKYSLAPVAEYLSKALGQEVKMAKDVVGESAKSIAASLQKRTIRPSQRSSLPWRKFMSMTHLARHTVRMLPPLALPTICRLSAAI